MKSLLLALAVVASVSGTGRVERQLEHPWGRWQPGAWVETNMYSTGWSEPLIERNQLDRFEGDGYSLESSLKIKGGEDVTTVMHRSWSFGGFAHVMPGATMVRREPMEVAGKRYECEVWQAQWSEKGEQVVDHVWLAPGFELPVRMRMASRKASFDTRLVQPVDFVKVAGRKLEAARYEGSGQSDGSAVEIRQWMSLEVPGGTARLETKVQEGNQEREVLREVVAFRGVPLRAR